MFLLLSFFLVPSHVRLLPHFRWLVSVALCPNPKIAACTVRMKSKKMIRNIAEAVIIPLLLEMCSTIDIVSSGNWAGDISPLFGCAGRFCTQFIQTFARKLISIEIKIVVFLCIHTLCFCSLSLQERELCCIEGDQKCSTLYGNSGR